jgi:hypothetical protein
VARDLTISAKAVESHVSSVLRKLQLSTRHDLTTWATDRRLVWPDGTTLMSRGARLLQKGRPHGGGTRSLPGRGFKVAQLGHTGIIVRAQLRWAMHRRRVVGGTCLVVVLGLLAAACNVEPVALSAEHTVSIGAQDTTAALTTLSDGTVVAVGESLNNNAIEVYQERFSSAGDVLPPANPTQVNATYGYREVDPTVVALPGATYAVLWVGDNPPSSPNTALFGRVFDSGGDPLTGDVLLADRVRGTTTGTTAAAALPGGGLVAAWTDQGDLVHAEQFSSTLGPIGSAVRVDEDPMLGNGQPAVAGLQDHGFAVTWTSNQSTEVRVFNAFDGAMGPAFTVGGSGPDPAVTTGLGDGNFVVVGEDLNPGETYGARDITAVRFDSYGNQVGPPVPVNEPDGRLVASPALAALPNGGYVAGWLEWTPGSNYTLQAHRFFANGVEVSPTIDTHQVGGLDTPAVTGLAGDGFAIWGPTIQFYLPVPAQ